jgi:hypothetical protein
MIVAPKIMAQWLLANLARLERLDQLPLVALEFIDALYQQHYHEPLNDGDKRILQDFLQTISLQPFGLRRQLPPLSAGELFGALVYMQHCFIQMLPQRPTINEFCGLLLSCIWVATKMERDDALSVHALIRPLSVDQLGMLGGDQIAQANLIEMERRLLARLNFATPLALVGIERDELIPGTEDVVIDSSQPRQDRTAVQLFSKMAEIGLVPRDFRPFPYWITQGQPRLHAHSPVP